MASRTLTNVYKYEIYPLHTIYDMLNSNVGDRRCLLSIAEKAYHVSLAFAQVVTKEWIVSYLNDNLAIDALSTLSLKASILHVDVEGPHIFSVSHGHWLSNLRAAKLPLQTYCMTTSNVIVDDLYTSFQKLHELSISFLSIHPLAPTMTST